MLFFTSNAGWYFCRKCKCHEGDHDIESFFSSYDSSFDFYSKEEVNLQLNKLGVKI
jgi:hypothetical protein